MRRDGSHESGAGSLYLALAIAQGGGYGAVQVFPHSPRNYRRHRPLDSLELARYRENAEEAAPIDVTLHASYYAGISNPTSTDKGERAMASLLEDLDTADALHASNVVVHPGRLRSAEDRDAAVTFLAELQRMRHDSDAWLLLETSASLNAMHSDPHGLIRLIEDLPDQTRIGVCLDTAHHYAAGRDLSDPNAAAMFAAAYRDTDLIRAVHFNNSRHPLGSGRDGHGSLHDGVQTPDQLRLLYGHLRWLLPDAPFLIEAARDVSEVHMMQEWVPIRPEMSTA